MFETLQGRNHVIRLGVGRIVSPTGYPAGYPVSGIRCQISGKNRISGIRYPVPDTGYRIVKKTVKNSEKQWKKLKYFKIIITIIATIYN